MQDRSQRILLDELAHLDRIIHSPMDDLVFGEQIKKEAMEQRERIAHTYQNLLTSMAFRS